jgi:hypothetical protein
MFKAYFASNIFPSVKSSSHPSTSLLPEIGSFHAMLDAHASSEVWLSYKWVSSACDTDYEEIVQVIRCKIPELYWTII